VSSTHRRSGAELSRRLVLAGASSLALAIACKKTPPSSCSDTSALSPDAQTLRKTVEYVDRSPNPATPCDRCEHWVAPSSADQCGGCKLIAGPIHPQVHCKLFVPEA
jgi:hypothetical protein